MHTVCLQYLYVLSLSTCRHLYTFVYTPSLSPHPIYHTPKSYAYNVNNDNDACTHTHTPLPTHTQAHACVHSHTCTHTIPMTSTTFTGLVTTTVAVPKMSSCGGGLLMVHVYTTFTSDSALSLPPPFFLCVCVLFLLFSFISFLPSSFGVGWFGLNYVWVKTVTKADGRDSKRWFAG